MNISSRCEYACRAVVELAKNPSASEPMTAQLIAERRNIPEKYLVHILLTLKRAGLVRSIRGAQGGYLLAKSPDEISVGDILRAIDGGVLTPLPVEDEAGQDLAVTWREIGRSIDAILEKITIRDLIERADHVNMYYI